MKAKVRKYAKFVVAALATAGVLVSSGLLPEAVAVWVNVGISAVGAGLVILVPNVELPARPEQQVGR